MDNAVALVKAHLQVNGYFTVTGARLVYDADPIGLVQRLTESYTQHHFRRPSCFCSEHLAASG